jgi:hypothetical protein
MGGLILSAILLLTLPFNVSAQAAEAFAGTPEGFEGLMELIIGASQETQMEMMESIRPDWEDYAVVFEDEGFAKKVFRFHRRLWKESGMVVRPLLEDQTELIYWIATQSALLEYSGEARNFPGGYREIAPYLNPELTYVRCKFVAPGRRLGSAYDMWVFVNGNWRLFPRPWAILF